MEPYSSREFAESIYQPASRPSIPDVYASQWLRNLEAHIEFYKIDYSTSHGFHAPSQDGNGVVIVVDSDHIYAFRYRFQDGQTDGFVFSSERLALRNLISVKLHSDSKVANGYGAPNISVPNVELFFPGTSVRIDGSHEARKEIRAMVELLAKGSERVG